MANAGGAGHGARMPFAKVYAAAGSRIGPLTVTSLNATSYGIARLRTATITDGNGK